MRYKISFELETLKLPSKWFQAILDDVLTAKERVYNVQFKLIPEKTDGGSKG